MVGIEVVLAATGDPSNFDWAQTGILGAVFGVIMWSGFTGKWMFTRYHDEAIAAKDVQLTELRSDRDFYRDHMMAVVRTAEAAAAVADKVADVAKERTG